MDNDATNEQTVEALYLGSSDDDDGHNMFTLSTKQKMSINKISMIPITTDILNKVNNMGKDEDQPDALDFTSLLSNINTHNNRIGVHRINTKNTLGTADTFYNIWEDSDSNKGNSELSLNSDMKDSKMHNQGSVVENPEVYKVNNHLPEEVREVPKEGDGNTKITIYNPSSDQSVMPTHDNFDTWNEQTPGFVGMTLTTDNNNEDDETSENESRDTNNMDDGDFFDESNETNIILSALYQAAHSRTSSPAGDKNCFEAVSVKFAITNIRHASTYTEIYTSSGARGINEHLTTSGYTPIFGGTLQIINNFIVDIKYSHNTAQPVIFPGLAQDDELLTGLCHEQEGLYAAFLEPAQRMRRIRPQHWASQNFNKARVIGLYTYYRTSIRIMNNDWNRLLRTSGQPILHDVSFQTLKEVFHNGIP